MGASWIIMDNILQAQEEASLMCRDEQGLPRAWMGRDPLPWEVQHSGKCREAGGEQAAQEADRHPACGHRDGTDEPKLPSGWKWPHTGSTPRRHLQDVLSTRRAAEGTPITAPSGAGDRRTKPGSIQLFLRIKILP